MKKHIKTLSKLFSSLLIITLLLTNIVVQIYATNSIGKIEVISSTLLELMESNPSETYRVIIWLEEIDTEDAINEALEKIPNYELDMARLCASSVSTEEDAKKWDDIISAKRNAMKSCYLAYTSSFSNSNLLEFETEYCCSYIPAVIANLTTERIYLISIQDDVKQVDIYSDDMVKSEIDNEINLRAIREDCYSVYEQNSYINSLVLEEVWGTTGYGINVGVLDGGKPDETYIGVQGANITNHYPNIQVESHTSYVVEIIYGTAPDVNFFCTTYFNVENASLLSEMEWFINNNVDVINMSLDVRDRDNGTIDSNNVYGSIAKTLDRYAKQYGVSIIISAGNEGVDGVESGGMAYNVITVGNYDRARQTIAESSSYNEIDFTEYAYKPDICAPGYFRFRNYHCDSGTSFSVPLTTGVVALLMSARGSLRIYPTQVKAILTASVSLNTPHDVPRWNSDYRQYGAGVIDAERASNIISVSNIVVNEITVSPNGSYHEYQIELFANELVRVSLAFEKNIDIVNEYSLANLDLKIYNSAGNLICTSITNDNNVEIVEFTPTVYDTYTIRVVMEDPAQSDNSVVATRYSIAWIQG